MAPYRCVGTVPHKRHTQLREESGSLLKEELISFGGFSDASSLLYHRGDPTEVLKVEPQPSMPLVEWRNGVQRHHRLLTSKLAGGGSPLDARHALVFNDDLTISVAAPTESDDAFYRNALSDELVLIAAGHGELHSQFGVLAYEPGDMVVIPRGTVQQWRLGGDDQQMVVVEAHSTIRPPGRYLNSFGQFLERSPYCERDIRAPEPHDAALEEGEFPVRVKLREEVNLMSLAWHPFDVVGWDGCVYPHAINMRDFEPITRRIHTMPDDHQIFEFDGGVVCCLVPRITDYHPLSVPSPPYHQNIEYDEVIYWLTDSYSGWEGVSNGTVTVHTRGMMHGPKPGHYEGSIGDQEFDGLGLMVDSVAPLRLAATAEECDDPDYLEAWRRKAE